MLPWSLMCFERSLVGVNFAPSSGKNSFVSSFFLDDPTTRLTNIEIGACRSCFFFNGFFGHSIISLIKNWFQPRLDYRILPGFDRGIVLQHNAKDCTLSHGISASVSSRFLRATFTRQSAGIKSYNMIALLIVCLNSKPLFCARLKSNQYTALCNGLHFKL